MIHRRSSYKTIYAKAEATEESKKLAIQNNRFALNFYAQLKQEKAEQGKNLFFSPFSLYTVLGMLYLGANDGGKQELAEVLGLQGLGDVGKEFYNLQGIILKKIVFDAEIALCNAAWISDSAKVLPAYENILREFFKAEIFKGKLNSPEVVKQINAWVEKQTQGRISNIIDENNLPNKRSRLILINTLYFKGFWSDSYKFERFMTGEKDFTLVTDKKVKVPMMHNSGQDYKYVETDQMQMIAIPYKGYSAHLYIVLPLKTTNLNAIETAFTPENLMCWITNMKPVKAERLMISKLKIGINFTANEMLKKLGVKAVFDTIRPVYLKGIDGGVDSLFVKQILQKTYFEVYEEGAEAVVVTEKEERKFEEKKSEIKEPPKKFTFEANRPFLFFIADREFKAILFIGRVMNLAEK
jgi:serpin B